MWIHHWNRVIKRLDFGDLVRIFKVKGDIRILNLDQNWFACTLCRKTIEIFLLNSHGYIIDKGYFKESNERDMHFVTGGALTF